MKCPRCQQENPHQAKFCLGCWAKWAVVCGGCGTANAPTQKVYDPEDSVRFYALRFREAGMIKSRPQRLIAEGTDWRSLNELRKELKG